MKKILLIVLAAIFTLNISAQKMYVGASFSYQLPGTKWAIGQKVTSDTKTNLYGSMGAGMRPALRFGYMFNDNFGAELGLGYFLGSKVTLSDKNTQTDGVVMQTATAKFMSASLQTVFRTSFGIYSKIGLYLPVSGSTFIEYDQKIATSHIVQNYELKGRMTTGFMGTIGYAYTLNDKIDLYLEAEYIGMKIYKKYSTMTAFTVNDVDQLPSLKKYSIETEFVDELPTAAQTDMNVAKKDLTSATQYSSFGFNLGLTFKF